MSARDNFFLYYFYSDGIPSIEGVVLLESLSGFCVYGIRGGGCWDLTILSGPIACEILNLYNCFPLSIKLV